MPAFGDKPIAELTRQTLQKYLFGFIEEGKHRTAEKLHQILCCIFDLACEDLHIPSPMKKIAAKELSDRKGGTVCSERGFMTVPETLVSRGGRSAKSRH